MMLLRESAPANMLTSRQCLKEIENNPQCAKCK